MSRRARRRKPRYAPEAAASDPAARRNGAQALSVAALLFASGTAALVYETVWVKQLGRVVGVEVHAVSIALSAFFAGLALGGALLGRLADRVPRPVRLYAQLEAGVAVLGVLATLALARSAPLFVALQEAVGPLAWALPFGLVGAPAVLMGGTLPALLRSLHPDDRRRGAGYWRPLRGQHRGRRPRHARDAVPARARLRHRGHELLRGGARPRRRVRRARPRSPRRGPGGGRADAGGGPATGRASRRALRPRPLRRGRRGSPRLRGRLVRAARPVPEHPELRFRGDAGHLPLGPRPRQLPVRPPRRGAVAIPGAALGVLLAGAGASALAIVALLGSWLPDAQTFAGMWAMRATGRETVEVSARFAVAAAVVLLVPTTFLGAAFPAAARLIASAPRVGRRRRDDPRAQHRRRDRGHAPHRIRPRHVAGAHPLARMSWPW